MTAEELAVGQARLRNKLLNVQQQPAILTDQASELSELLATVSQTLLHRPAELRLTPDEITKMRSVQELADKIRGLEQNERELQEKVKKFPRLSSHVSQSFACVRARCSSALREPYRELREQR